MEEIILRNCCICKIDKPLDQYYNCEKECLGKRYTCKKCEKNYSRKYTKSPNGILVIRKSRKKNKENALFLRARSRAKEKGIEFTIIQSDVIIPEICPILGILINRDSRGLAYDSAFLKV